ncbi:MAG: esterase [Moritella sp.]|jgi:esterase
MLLNHKIYGQGDPVIVIHGLFGSATNLGMLSKQLKTDHQVIAVDVRNHGLSERHHSMHYDDMANDIIQLMDHLAINQAHLVGHSMGGKIAMRCALNFPQRVASLVVADIAPVSYPARHDNVFRGLKNIPLANINSRSEAQEKLAEYVEAAGVQQFLLKGLHKNDQGQYDFYYALGTIINEYDNISDWPDIEKKYDKPVLFIKGMNSDYITNTHKSAIGHYFPNATAKLIQGAGHWLHAEKPAAFNKIIVDFLFSHQQ